MGCGPSVQKQQEAPPRERVTLTTTSADMGVKMSPHILGDYVESVPAGSHGAAIGLQEGDIITKAGSEGDIQFPVKYYQGVHRVSLILNNTKPVSEATPMSMLILRGGDEEKKRPRSDSKTSTKDGSEDSPAPSSTG